MSLLQVFCEYVLRGILSPNQAVKIVQDLLFHTSNRLYKLNLSLEPTASLTSPEVGPQQINNPKIEGLEKFLEFIAHPERSIDYIFLQWLDYTATLRVRVLPKKQAIKRFKEGKLIGITKAVLGLLQQDAMCPGFTAVGEYTLYPDFDSLRIGATTGEAVVQCEFREKSGGEAVPICPRTVLRNIVEKSAIRGTSFLIGFEVEVVFMDQKLVEGQFHYDEEPARDGHTWSGARALQDTQMTTFVSIIVSTLSRSGIEVEQLHPESAPGQWEFILSPSPPLQAVDTLLVARGIIHTIARSFSKRATLVPKAYPSAAGSGAHVHMSMTPLHQYEMFYAGVLKHLRAIAAFTYSNAASYERAGDSVWAGGTWVAYGSQNREAPLRKIEDSHWELKCMDGLANPYLALSAIIGAGLQGILDKEVLTMKDCTKDPAALTEEEKTDFGISERLPQSIDEALDCLRHDTQLRDIMGGAVIDTYLTVKKAECEMLQAMAAGKRRNWLIERY